jgi:very-short-patch-repair endonuclease
VKRRYYVVSKQERPVDESPFFPGLPKCCETSEFETRMNRLWDRLGLPHTERQFPVTVDGTTYRLDRAIVAEKIGPEWDSYRYHNATSDRDYDSNRRARLVGAGWLIVPVTANTEPELVARAVLRAYQDRRGQTSGQAGGRARGDAVGRPCR